LEVLYLLIPVAFILVALAVKLFFWAVKSGQYDDLDTEGKRILFEENPSKTKANTSTNIHTTPGENNEHG